MSDLMLIRLHGNIRMILYVTTNVFETCVCIMKVVAAWIHWDPFCFIPHDRTKTLLCRIFQVSRGFFILSYLKIDSVTSPLTNRI